MQSLINGVAHFFKRGFDYLTPTFSPLVGSSHLRRTVISPFTDGSIGTSAPAPVSYRLQSFNLDGDVHTIELKLNTDNLVETPDRRHATRHDILSPSALYMKLGEFREPAAKRMMAEFDNGVALAKIFSSHANPSPTYKAILEAEENYGRLQFVAPNASEFFSKDETNEQRNAKLAALRFR